MRFAYNSYGLWRCDNISTVLTTTQPWLEGHVMAAQHSISRFHHNQRIRFKRVVGFPGYFVGSDGSVWSTWRRHYTKGRFRCGVKYRMGGPWLRLKPSVVAGGYLGLSLRRNGKGHHQLVHVLVLRAFRGNAPPSMECAHENGIPTDNRLENLSWKTKKANQADRARHGTHNRGERHGEAKITDRQAVEVIRRVAAGETRTAVARDFGISRTVVGKIVAGKAWRHIRETFNV